MNIYKAIIPAEPEKHRKGKLMKKKNNLTFFKGFDKNMRCRGFQYVEGETYEQLGEIGVCVNGFHACSLPLDVLSYYPVRDGNLYHEVKLDGISENDGGDSKVAAREITVGVALNLVELIKAHVNAVTTGDNANAATTGDNTNAVTTGDYANAATTGDDANAATTGHWANAATTGDYANAATTGDNTNAVTTGDNANAATTGDNTNAVTTGDYANAATTGDDANAATTGHWANAATTGRWANAATTGRFANAATTGYSVQIRSSVHDPDAVAAVLGEGAARGVKGSWIVLTERDGEWNLIEVRAIQVDGETVKENQYYRLSGGNLVEVND